MTDDSLSIGEFSDNAPTPTGPLNLVVAVRDHAPIRLDNIKQEMARLHTRLAELQREHDLHVQLLEVVQP